jgi:hypothetical protein
MKLIDFISVSEGLVELFSGDEFIAAYRSPMMLADCIMKNGIVREVDTDPSWNAPEEHGFDSKEELFELWTEVVQLMQAKMPGLACREEPSRRFFK